MSLKNSRYAKYFATRTVGVESIGLIIQFFGFADRNLAGLNAMHKVYKKLCRKYSKSIKSASFTQYESKYPDKVWFCWLQGIENAPEVVKNCYDSINYHIKDKEIIVLTAENFADYCALPDYIIDKWKTGKITNTHFSDILRLQLLIENGGLWVDSTVYMTDKLPEYIEKESIFLYKTGWFGLDLINIGSWLIKSEPNNILLCEVQELLFKYWKTHNYLCHYFLLHLFFRMVSNAYKEEFDSIPYYHQADQHILANVINKTFNQERFNDIKAVSSVHKLTYKTEKLCFEENSYYSKLKELYKL